MSEPQRPTDADERLSALVDNEVTDAEAEASVDALLRDPQARSRWARYHTERTAIHGERTDWLSPGFANRVSAAVDAEPRMLAPQPRAPARSTAWRRRVGGGAIAAGIALVTAAVVFSVDTAPDSPGVELADGRTQPVASEGVSPVRLTAEAADGISQAARERMGQYLARHAEATGMDGLPGVLPFSRLSGFNANQ